MSQHDDLFQQLGRTLDVSPSRDFADGVRSRIARRRLIVRSTMSGLAMAATLVLVAVVRWSAPVSIAVLPADTPPMVVLSHVAPPATPSVAPRVPPPAGPRHAPTRQRPRVTPEPEPERLHVVTNQMAVLRAAWAGAQATVVETDAPVAEPATSYEPTRVVVEPVRVLPVVIADHRTPLERIPTIRRAVAALETK